MQQERTSGAKARKSLCFYGTAEAVPFVQRLFPQVSGGRSSIRSGDKSVSWMRSPLKPKNGLNGPPDGTEFGNGLCKQGF
jgi:hypothetical protein